MAKANSTPPHPQLSVRALMIWAACFGVLFACNAALERALRQEMGSIRFDSPDYQWQLWFRRLFSNTTLLAVLVVERLAAWQVNCERHREGLPPITMREKWAKVKVRSWLSGMVAVPVFGFVILILNLCVKFAKYLGGIVFFNEPATATGIRVAIVVLTVAVFIVPVIHMVLLAVEWALLPFVWVWGKLFGSRADVEASRAEAAESGSEV